MKALFYITLYTLISQKFIFYGPKKMFIIIWFLFWKRRHCIRFNHFFMGGRNVKKRIFIFCEKKSCLDPNQIVTYNSFKYYFYPFSLCLSFFHLHQIPFSILWWHQGMKIFLVKAPKNISLSYVKINFFK